MRIDHSLDKLDRLFVRVKLVYLEERQPVQELQVQAGKGRQACDNVFKRRDVRVSTTEIESAALDAPGVRMAVALPPTARRDLELVVTGDCDADDVLRRLRDWLEPAKVPSRCTLLADLPLTAHGKADRAGIEAMLEQR